jgi:hypothetical protein
MTTPDKAYRWWYRDPLTKIFFRGAFAKIGVRNLSWTNYASVTDKTPEQREQMLRQTETAFAKLRQREHTRRSLAYDERAATGDCRGSSCARRSTR